MDNLLVLLTILDELKGKSECDYIGIEHSELYLEFCFEYKTDDKPIRVRRSVGIDMLRDQAQDFMDFCESLALEIKESVRAFQRNASA